MYIEDVYTTACVQSIQYTVQMIKIKLVCKLSSKFFIVYQVFKTQNLQSTSCRLNQLLSFYVHKEKNLVK